MTNVLNKPGLIAYFDDFREPEVADYEWRVLSNFYQGDPIKAWLYGPDGKLTEYSFATGEHMFAALKAATWDDFFEVMESFGPSAAKSIGRSIELREDWESIKYDAMAFVLRLKFTLDREEGEWLLRTGDALLIEGTHWNDSVWGVQISRHASDPLKAYGRNWLGTLLMARRAELVAEKAYGVAASTVTANWLFSDSEADFS